MSAPSLSRKQLAERAGVNSDYVRRLIDLGVLTPGEEDAFSPGDVGRARLLKSLEEAGMPVDGIGAAIGSGHLSFGFLDLPNFDRFSGLSGKTFRELSAETGVPLELLQTVREAIGLAHPNPDDPVRDELGVLPSPPGRASPARRAAPAGRELHGRVGRGSSSVPRG